jgi:UDP-glucose 4-epimerase
MDMALRGKPLTIFGDGRQTRDFVFVSDVVDAYLAAAGLAEAEQIKPGTGSAPDPNHRIFNIGTGMSTSVLELAKLLQELVGRDEPFLFMPNRPGDIRHSHASVSAFHKQTGWKAKVSLRDGLQSTLQWYRSALA